MQHSAQAPHVMSSQHGTARGNGDKLNKVLPLALTGWPRRYGSEQAVNLQVHKIRVTEQPGLAHSGRCEEGSRDSTHRALLAIMEHWVQKSGESLPGMETLAVKSWLFTLSHNCTENPRRDQTAL